MVLRRPNATLQPVSSRLKRFEIVAVGAAGCAPGGGADGQDGGTGGGAWRLFDQPAAKAPGRAPSPLPSRRARALVGAMTDRRPLWLAAAPVVFLLLWSAGFGVAKLGLQHAQPLTLLALRYVLVLVVLAPFAAVLRPPPPRGLRGWIDVAVVGFLIQVAYFGLCYLAFKSGVSAGGVAIVVCLQPILVALIAPSFVGEAVGRRAWIGLALGLAGAATVILARSQVAAENPLGVLMTVGALLGITAGTLYEKRFGVGHHPVTSNLIQYAVGAAFAAPLALLTEDVRIDWTGEFVAVMAYLVLGNSLLAMTLLLAMIRAGRVSEVSALFYLVPAVSALFAWPLLGEAMPPLAWAGMALAGAGVALAGGRIGRRAQAPDDARG
jgi:drug/metabolite transporter (DMT)-like permease